MAERVFKPHRSIDFLKVYESGSDLGVALRKIATHMLGERPGFAHQIIEDYFIEKSAKRPKEKLDDDSFVCEIPGITLYVINILEREKIFKIGQLKLKTQAQLLAIKSLSKLSVNRLLEAIKNT